MRKRAIPYLFITTGLLLAAVLVAGQGRGKEAIKKAIEEKQYEQAKQILEKGLNDFKAQKQADSLVQYIFITGEVYQDLENKKSAITKVNTLVAYIQKMKTTSLPTLVQANIEAGDYFGSIGMNQTGYNANVKAQNYIRQYETDSLPDLALTENNLATFAQRLGDLALSKQHGRQSLQYLLAQKEPPSEKLYYAYNNMGSALWYSSKTDSAAYYYQLALDALSKSEPTPMNQFFRPAILYNNLAAIYQIDGITTKAIEAMEKTISNLRTFLKTDFADNKKTSALTFQFEATDNLAGIYKDLGDLSKAKDLLEYSYQQKQKLLSADYPGIYISKIILGQLYYAMHDYDKATEFLLSGIKKIHSSDGSNLSWEADAISTLALIADAKKDTINASHYFEKADSLYAESLQGEFDVNYLDFLRIAAFFYAEGNQTQRALSKAKKSYNYVVKNQGALSLSAFYEMLNLAEINFIAHRPEESLAWANKALEVVEEKIKGSRGILDSIKMELKKPKVILRKGKALYQLRSHKNEAFIHDLIEEMEEALYILDRQKSILSDPQDIGYLVEDHSELLDFIKQLTRDLYKMNGETALIDKLISYHEGGIYQRIRARLDKSDSIKFAHISPKVLNKERALKNSIGNSLTGPGSHNVKLENYFFAVEAYQKFRNQLKVEYPKYYNLRYATIFKPLSTLENEIPKNTTLIRYFFIQKELYALVLERGQKKLIGLPSVKINEQIKSLLTYDKNIEQTATLLKDLYDQLWQPLEKHINGKKIIIIPDEILFSLNFEILTPKRINQFKDLATNSLLYKYPISYQYSLFLFNPSVSEYVPKGNYIGFAPGFSDQLKSRYQPSKEAIIADKSYLSLLPQPFSLNLARESVTLFGGKAYLENSSTVKAFKENAGNHQLIYIGTHAESNNDHPAYSRLLFAKDMESGSEKNSLYLDEIYNCNLTSDLTLLTACESGKPGYKDGEGMVSLAHAFNYAGSRSILTGLWKIDEQASVLILEDFYQNLVKGLPKDEALRKAKLSYLQIAEGRMLEPQYWAGLMILGDSSPIVFAHSGKNYFGLVAIAVLLIFVSVYTYQRKKKLKIINQDS